MNIESLIIKQNITDKIKNIKNLLMNECLSQRHNHDKELSYNYCIDSKYTNYLYDIFYQVCKNKLNSFNLLDVNFKVWCFLSDKNYNKSTWHNHTHSSTINCVIYLETQNKGIFFRHEKNDIYMLPEDNDMLIFPSFLDHYPETSKKEPRITLNLELRCKESTEKIFNI